MSLSSGLPAQMPILVSDVRTLGGFRLEITFSDGSAGVRDFTGVTKRAGPMARPLADPTFFARAFVDDGVLTWPNGYDWDPDALHASMLVAGQLSRRHAAESRS